MIEASKDFVCIRLATYEDAEEAKFLKDIFAGRSGELENTVFCLLGPDGKTKLSKASRGPFMFRSPESMAKEMKTLAEGYELNDSDVVARLPQMKNFRLALNVSECDALPLLVCVGENTEQVKSLSDRLSPLALDSSIAGKFAFYSTEDASELTAIEGDKPTAGYVLIVPGQFGTDGVVKKTLAADISAEDLEKQLADFASEYKPRDKDRRGHIRDGQESGVDWKTEIPVTDPMSNRAKDRSRSGEEGRGDRSGPPRDGKGKRGRRGGGELGDKRGPPPSGGGGN